MSGFLDDREHAAENLFVHNEEMLFLARRAGVRDLARWAADAMGLAEAQRDTYVATLIDTMVDGSGDAAILQVVTKDLEAAGRGSDAADAARVLSQAVALAGDELSGRRPRQPLGRPASQTPKTHPIGASLSWRD